MRTISSSPSRSTTRAGRLVRSRFALALACAVGCQTPLLAEADAASLAFLAGCWRQEDGESHVDEVWLEPAGGVLLGMSRTVEAGRLANFEFMRVEAREGVLVFVAHPQGEPPTEFRSTRLGDRSVTFENAAHDFPQLVRYWSSGMDLLSAEIGGRVGERMESASFSYRRVACP